MNRQNSRPSPFHIVLVTIFIFLISLLLWGMIFFRWADAMGASKGEMLKDVSSVFAQVVLVTLLGAAVTFFYNRYAQKLEDYQLEQQKKQEQRMLKIEEDNKLRRQLLGSIIEVRAQVERARREFRLLSPKEWEAGYRKTIGDLLDARLHLSQVWHDSDIMHELYSKDEFKDEDLPILVGLKGMKKYLDNLIGEYEGHREAFQDAAQEASLENMKKIVPCFAEFIIDQQQEDEIYETVFLGHYHKVTHIIRKSILSSMG